MTVCIGFLLTKKNESCIAPDMESFLQRVEKLENLASLWGRDAVLVKEDMVSYLFSLSLDTMLHLCLCFSGSRSYGVVEHALQCTKTTLFICWCNFMVPHLIYIYGIIVYDFNLHKFLYLLPGSKVPL